MKKISSSVAITAATDEGTIFYKVTRDDLDDYYKDDDNIVVKDVIRYYGFDAFDIDRMYGSALIDDELYICVTDYEPILVNGEEVDPEKALKDFDIEDLEDYIQPADDEIMRRYVSYYEFDASKIDIDEEAYELLGHNHSLITIIQDMQAIGLLDDII